MRALGLALAVALAVAGSVAVADDAVVAEVTYLTGASVYLSAGRDDGLELGDRLQLMRGDTLVAVLEVSDLSAHRAACRIHERTLEPAMGDTVRVEVAGSIPKLSGSELEPAADSSRPRRSPRGHALRGRIGLRHLVVNDRTDGSSGLSQPALDLRLDGRQIGGTPWDLAVDVRARRTYRDLAGGGSDDDGRTRVYRLAVSRRSPDDPWSYTVGRQYAAALSAVSFFDGVSVEYTGGPGWSAGLVSGTQPEPLDYGYSSDIHEHGVYVQFRRRPSPRRSWRLTTGLIGSYEASEVNREFAYLQGRYNGPRLSVYATQEVDYNRGWKVDAGEKSLSSTSSFVVARYRVNDSVLVDGGYDNRRRVRLYRDLVTPVTDFDDTYRRGLWAGASLRFLDRYRAGLTLRSRGSQGTGDADSYTLTLAADRLSRWGIGLRSRSTRFTNDSVEGWLHALDASVEMSRRATLSISGGLRSEDDLLIVSSSSDLSWFGIHFDLRAGRHWYLLLSVERADGDLEEIDQIYSSLTYRF